MPGPFTTPVAKSTPFDNTTNGFVAGDVQAAIEEAKAQAEGFPRICLRSTYNSTVSNNQWLGPNELLPNTPLVKFPVNIRLNEISWSNQTADVRFYIEFRKGSKTNPIFYTLTVNTTNDGTGYITGLTDVFVAGDKIYAQYIDDGLNVSDMDLCLWVTRIP